MKKTLFILFLGSTTLLSANIVLLDFSMNNFFNAMGAKGSNVHSYGLNFVILPGDEHAFYAHFNPYLYINLSPTSEVLDTVLSAEALFGMNTILGYGVNINLDRVGFLIGGGGFFDMYAVLQPGQFITEEFKAGAYSSISLGLGAGTHFYVQPGSGSFLLNVGLATAWAPLSYIASITEIDPKHWFKFLPEQFHLNVNIGIGWMK